jgi:dimethylhistidine N-methyltransferase
VRAIAEAVSAGLSRAQKSLPPWLFYDEVGSALFEQITALPEYYPTRTERAIFVERGESLLRQAAGGHEMTVIELGAGTANKTQVLLAELHKLQPSSVYIPVDVSASALAKASLAIRAQFMGKPGALVVKPLLSSTEQIQSHLLKITGRMLVLFIGSSIGNYEHDEAIALLRSVREGLSPGDALLLGTDLRKDLRTLINAYDDGAGVTAAFNRNMLVRINRELAADFQPERFAHLAVWNEQHSRIEMHLKSIGAQRVHIGALDADVLFADGETIHTESSVKYDSAMVEQLLYAAGFSREVSYSDSLRWFAVHLARVA